LKKEEKGCGKRDGRASGGGRVPGGMDKGRGS